MIINKKIANVNFFFLLNPILKYINEKVENTLNFIKINYFLLKSLIGEIIKKKKKKEVGFGGVNSLQIPLKVFPLSFKKL